MLFLAYPIYQERQETIEQPLILDPQSCMYDGFILCEADSILTSIPGIEENPLCTRVRKLGSPRGKRSVDDLFSNARGTTYEINEVVQKTLSKQNENRIVRAEIESLVTKIKDIELEAQTLRNSSRISLESAERAQHRVFWLMIFILCLVLAAASFGAKVVLVYIKKCRARQAEKELETLRLRLASVGRVR